MKFSEKLEANWKARKWPLVKDLDEDTYSLFTTKDIHGNVRNSYWCLTEQGALYSGIADLAYRPENIDSKNLQIIRTIDPMELMGPGYELGQKVRILPNAKEECEKWDIFWSENHQLMLEDGVGAYSGTKDAALKLFYKDDDKWACFPPSALEPYFDEEMVETVKIGEVTYNKAEFEEAVKNLKPVK